MSRKPVVYLIDGSSQMYRAYHAPVRTSEGGLLRNAQGEHAILQVGFDAACVQFTAEREASPIARQPHLGIDRLEFFGRERRHRSFDHQRVALDLQFQMVLGHARQIGQQRDARVVFQHIHARQQGSRVLACIARHILLGVGRLNFIHGLNLC